MKLRPELLNNLIEQTNLLQERIKIADLTMLDRLGMLRAQIAAFEHSVETGNLLTEEETVHLFEEEVAALQIRIEEIIQSLLTQNGVED